MLLPPMIQYSSNLVDSIVSSKLSIDLITRLPPGSLALPNNIINSGDILSVLIEDKLIDSVLISIDNNILYGEHKENHNIYIPNKKQDKQNSNI